MPEMMFRHHELEKAIRLAWVTGVRDAIVSMQDKPLSQEQADRLAPYFINDDNLRATVLAILETARHVS